VKLLKKHLKETDKVVQITGYRNLDIGNSKEFVKKIREKLPQKTWIQFFDPSVIATWQHLFFAIVNAELSFKNGRNISKSIEMETLLYASAQHQINKAIKKIGIKTDSSDIAIVIVANEEEQIDEALLIISRCLEKKPDESVIEFSDKKHENISKVFDISKKEIKAILKDDNIRNAIRDIVLERMALLSTRS
jgi:tRNA threonylcarbamoyladenosine modification (KEOPS) complex Cgi121 subunit